MGIANSILCDFLSGHSIHALFEQMSGFTAPTPFFQMHSLSAENTGND
jgi:hypothetical protein